MREIIKKQFKILTVAAVAALSLTSASHAAINLDFVYDAGANITTATYSGHWDLDHSADTTYSGTTQSMGSSYLYTFQGDYSRLDGGTSVTLPWASGLATLRSGANFGLTSVGRSIGPIGFTDTTPIDGYMTFTGDLASLGFDAAEIASGGVIAASAGNVIWTATVPEPTTSAVLFGFVSLAGCALRRRLN